VAAVAVALGAVSTGCGHTDISDHITARVTATRLGVVGGLCIDGYYLPGGRCFGVRQDLLGGIRVGDCVSVTYVAPAPQTESAAGDDFVVAPMATGLEPAADC
jgi:hypothetical protein